MKKRFLAFSLALTLIMGNMSSVYAAENVGGVYDELEETVEEGDEETGSEEDSEEENTEESEEETEETTDEETEEETDEEETEAVEDVASEESVEEEAVTDDAIDSTSYSFVVDKTAPYSGQYLIMTNNNVLYSNTGEAVGNLSGASYSEESFPEEDHIMNYDDDGRAIIEKAFDESNLTVDPAFGDISPEDLHKDEQVNSYSVGNTRTYYLDMSATDDNVSPVTCVCVSVGDNCTIWVPTDDPLYLSSPTKMRSEMDKLRDEYESHFTQTVNAFGDMEYADLYGDQDGKVAFVCYDIDGDGATNTYGGYVGGYFYGADLNFYSNGTGSKADCLHIDSWQGMSRSSNGLTINATKPGGTMMHELQHMIFWSNMRKLEKREGLYLGSQGAPSWINEGFSEAAIQLCYGLSSGRIETFNSYRPATSGSVSICGWNSSVSSYAVDYLFFQYVRTQYAQVKGTDGWDIYSLALSKIHSSSSNYTDESGVTIIDAMAEEIGVTREELFENFWIAVTMLNAKGPYGFNGESWAETIKTYPNTSPVTTLRPGSSQLISLSGNFTPSGNGTHVVFAGLDKSKKVESVTIAIEGTNVINRIGDTTQLTATNNKGDAASVTWSIPNAADRNIISVNSSGLVTALDFGTATVKATLNSDSDVTATYTIKVVRDSRYDIGFSTGIYNNGYGKKTLAVSTTYDIGATIYYTLDGTIPTKSDAVMPVSGVVIDKVGTTRVGILAVAPGYNDTSFVAEVTIDKANMPVISAVVDDEGNCDITITSDLADSDIFFSLDVTSPLNGTKYTGVIHTSIEDIQGVKAVVRKSGYADSDIAEYNFDEYNEVNVSDIMVNAIYGGYTVDFSVYESDVNTRYTLDGTKPTKTGMIFPENGITIDRAGATTITITSWKAGCRAVTRIATVEVGKTAKPVITSEWVDYRNEYVINVTDDSDNDGLRIYYSLDGAEYKLYESSIAVDAGEAHTISAYAESLGAKSSLVAAESLSKKTISGKALANIPRVLPAVVTLNKKWEPGSAQIISVMPFEGEEVMSVSLEGKNSEAFSVDKIDEDSWAISIISDDIKAGAYKLNLLMRGTEFSSESPKKAVVTVKVIDKVPVVTLKRVNAYKNYSGVVTPLEISSKEGHVEILGIRNNSKVYGFTDNFELIDDDSDGHLDSIIMSDTYGNLVTDSRNIPVLSGLLTVKVDGYKTQDITLNVVMNNTLPKIAQTAVPKYNFKAFADDGYKATVKYTITNRLNKRVNFTDITDVKVDTASRQYNAVAGILDASPVSFDGAGNITIQCVSSLDGVKGGTYTVPLLMSGVTDVGSFSNVAATAKFTIDRQNIVVKTVLSPANLMINKQMNDHAYTTVKTNYPNVVVTDMICTAMPASGKSNLDEKVKLRFNAATSQLEAYFDGYVSADDIVSTSYKFDCVPVLESVGSSGAVATDQHIKVTVSVVNKNTTVIATPKGTINVLDRAGTSISYTIRKSNFYAAYNTDSHYKTVTIAAPTTLMTNEIDGSTYFELESDADDVFDATGKVVIKLKENAEIINGKRYVIRIGILLENGTTVYSTNLKVVPRQVNKPLVQNKIPTLYKNVNMRKRVDTFKVTPGVGEIESIKLNDVKNKRLPAGLKVELSDTDITQIDVKLTDSSVRAGTYVINLDIVYKGEMQEKSLSTRVYAATVKVVVK